MPEFHAVEAEPVTMVYVMYVNVMMQYKSMTVMAKYMDVDRVP